MKAYTDSLKRLADDHGMPSGVLTESVAYSDTVAAAIMAWSKKDRYLQTRGAPEYMVNDSPGRWVPTPPAYTPAMEPHWSEIRYVVMDSVREFMPPPPYTFNVTDKNSPYYQEVKKIENKGDSLSQEETWIADFWDDNPFKLNVSGHLMFGTKKFSPGAHWLSITGIAAKKAGADFPTTVTAYAKTSIALFDAFIQCWNIKYYYNTMRPETAIDKYFDPNWRPHLQTPPFPEYTCGHCTISASAAEALTSVFGDRFSYTDTTELEFGIPSRSFPSFRDAAAETEKSRFYGGIHYQYSCAVSHKMGTAIGSLVAARLTMKKKNTHSLSMVRIRYALWRDGNDDAPGRKADLGFNAGIVIGSAGRSGRSMPIDEDPAAKIRRCHRRLRGYTNNTACPQQNAAPLP